LPTSLIALQIRWKVSVLRDDIAYPNFVKPVMSSSGKGQSRVKSFEEVDAA
jgi:formate-dependent phosphoribosylglycinamide formyltransferase (GAR transformylase)